MEERSYEQLEKVAADANTLAAFLGPRDVLTLTQEAILARLGQRQADVMALFGGSILAGGDVLAAAMRARVAGTYVIVGGAGHTTETLRERVRTLCPDLSLAAGTTEAEIFEAYLDSRHGLLADFLERRSTNCGNNITYLRDLLKERGVRCKSLILVQDATMQRRMSAGLSRGRCRTSRPSTSPPTACGWSPRTASSPTTGSRWGCGTHGATCRCSWERFPASPMMRAATALKARAFSPTSTYQTR